MHRGPFSHNAIEQLVMICFVSLSGTVARGLTIIAGRSPVGIGAQASANQKKLNEPGGGTFRYVIG